MKKAYTIKDLAAFAEVSRSTVSRVLNNVHTKVPVSEATRQRILEASRHFDYQPNINARRLAVNRSYVIGLQVPAHMPNTYVFNDYNLIGAMHGIESAITKTRYRLQFLFQNDAYIQGHGYLNLLKNRSIDGLLIWGALTTEEFVPELRDYPVLFLNTVPKMNHGIASILHDDYHGSMALTLKLIGRGVRRFVYLAGPESASIAIDRRRGFEDAIRKAGLTMDQQRILPSGNFRHQDGEVLSRPLFRRGQKLDFDAICCVNDTLATAVYDVAVEQGFVPQKDFLLSGADGVEDCARYNLFTYQCDRFEMGRRAIEEIIKLIEHPGAQESDYIIPILGD